MDSYIQLVDDVLNTGERIPNRTGIDACMTVGKHFTHDMRDGFPLLTTKKLNLHTIAVELEGFIKGITDKRWYQERKCYIWDEWCNPQVINDIYGHSMSPDDQLDLLIKRQETTPSLSPKMAPLLDKLQKLNRNISFAIDVQKAIQLYETDLGPIYGYQWRSFAKQYKVNQIGNTEYSYDASSGIDQLKMLVDRMKTNPLDRRMLVSAWNPVEIDANTMALPPCHWAFEVHSNGNEFDLIWHQRSVDIFLGLPYNIASYALLMKLLESETGLIARKLHGFLGNAHIYSNHLDQIKLQRSREPYALPTLILPDDVNIFDWDATQWKLENYQHHPFIKGDVAV